MSDRIEIVENINKGSFSTVYHAIDKSQPKPIDVALKILNLNSYGQSKSSVTSFFLREAYGISKLKHPNIVKMLDDGSVLSEEIHRVCFHSDEKNAGNGDRADNRYNIY